MGIPGPYFCGPQWAPVWLRRWLSQAFNRCCEDHDNAYEVDARSSADRAFRRCLICEAMRRHIGWHIVALIFGWSVTVFGWLFKRPELWPWQRFVQFIKRGFR